MGETVYVVEVAYKDSWLKQTAYSKAEHEFDTLDEAKDFARKGPIGRQHFRVIKVTREVVFEQRPRR